MTYGNNVTLGIVLMAIVSILAAQKVSKTWNDNEPLSVNVKVSLASVLFPRPHAILGKPIEIQANYWDKYTWLSEVASTALVLKIIGGPLYAPSFGPRPTRIASMTIPSTEDPNYLIPVVCAAPHDATMETKLPLILYFYMGGLVMGSIQAELPLSRWLAQEAHAVVCSVGYRKVPKYPYPIPVNDVVDASIGILERYVSIASLLGTGIDVDRVATWGMSAGGYMSAQASRRLTERGYHIKCQVSLVPMAKPHGGTQSILTNWDDLWSGSNNVYSWTMFLPGDDGTLANDWRVSLLVDPPEDIRAKLPPTYIQVNKRDVLHDEGEMYAKKLKSQGKLIEMREYDVSHVGGHPNFAGGGSAEDGMDHAVSILKKYL